MQPVRPPSGSWGSILGTAVLARTKPSANALKLRKARARRKLGLASYRLLLDEVATELLLEREQLLPPGRDHSHQNVERALAEFVRALINIEL